MDNGNGWTYRYARLLNSWITQVGRWTAEFSFKKNKDGQSILTGMYI